MLKSTKPAGAHFAPRRAATALAVLAALSLPATGDPSLVAAVCVC